VEARNPHDAHRPLGQGFDLDSILCLREERVLASDYTLQLHGKKLAIARKDVLPGLRHARVLVEHRLDGSLWVRFKKTHIPLSPAPVAPAVTPSGLRPPAVTARRKPYWTPKSRPAPDHPWRGTFLPGRKGDISTWR
jgi:hypothetical protein